MLTLQNDQIDQKEQEVIWWTVSLIDGTRFTYIDKGSNKRGGHAAENCATAPSKVHDGTPWGGKLPCLYRLNLCES